MRRVVRGLAPVVVVAALGLAPGCANPPAAPPVPDASDLRTCPQGDGPWRAALGRATDPKALALLEATAREAGRSCPERWEPRWAAAESLFRRSSFDLARPLYDEALERARGGGDAVGIACAANRLGSLHYFRAELDPARDRFEEALASARLAGRNDLAAFVLNNLAGLLKETGELSRAATLFEEAVEALTGMGLAKPARAAAYNAAALRLNLGDLRGADEALRAVVEAARAAGDVEVESSASIALGNLSMARADATAARGWYERAVSDSAQVRVSKEVGLGRAALALGDPGEARRRFEAAASLAREKGLVLDAYLAEIRRAEALFAEGIVRLRLGLIAQRVGQVLVEGAVPRPLNQPPARRVVARRRQREPGALADAVDDCTSAFPNVVSPTTSARS